MGLWSSLFGGSSILIYYFSQILLNDHYLPVSDYGSGNPSLVTTWGADDSKARMVAINLTPIGTVRSTRKQAEDDNWDLEKVYIELDSQQFTSDSLLGLSEFSHAEILFHMNQVDPSKIEKTARHPRNNTEWPKVGIFAQRGKNRPNQIGTTVCRILKVEGSKLHLEGLDAIEGSPVLDIKPWVQEFAPRGSIFQPKWISELMRQYWRS